MKKYLSILLLLFAAMSINAQIVSDKEAGIDCVPEKGVYDTVDEIPMYPGGVDALMQYLSSNIIYPQNAVEYGVEGTVLIHFIVEKNGSISHIKVERSASHIVEIIDDTTGAKTYRDLGLELDREAVRAVKNMPRWTPGQHEGKAVRVQFHLPIAFSLN